MVQATLGADGILQDLLDGGVDTLPAGAADSLEPRGHVIRDATNG
jgi:hypothetical protein